VNKATTTTQFYHVH